MPYGRVNAGRDFVKPAQCCQVVLKYPLKHATVPILLVGELTSPEIVACFTGFRAGTIYNIVKAKNQFHGFEGYPDILASIKINITGFVAIANNYNHPKRKSYMGFIENAKNAASENALTGFSDPSSKGLYGWRTMGAGEPGGNFKRYQDRAGQTFYTLK